MLVKCVWTYRNFAHIKVCWELDFFFFFLREVIGWHRNHRLGQCSTDVVDWPQVYRSTAKKATLWYLMKMINFILTGTNMVCDIFDVNVFAFGSMKREILSRAALIVFFEWSSLKSLIKDQTASCDKSAKLFNMLFSVSNNNKIANTFGSQHSWS